jgi:hypothetical protein
MADEIELACLESWLLAFDGDTAGSRRLLRQATEAADGIVLSIAADEVAHVAARVHVLIGDGAAAREVLSGLAERLDARGMRRFADRYRRDLAALGH